MNIGFIGTGLLGFPMAKRVIDKGYQLIAYNRTHEKAEPLKNYGASVKTNPEELLKYSDVVILVLTDIKAINECLFSNIELLKNKTIIQMSTISPQESIDLSIKFKNYGAEYIEAPVLGSRPEAEQGKLIVMAGGEIELFEKVKDILKIFTDEPLYIGEIGKASTLKLSLNHLIASLTSSFCLSLGIIQKSGIEVETFMDILRKSALYAPTFDKKLGKMLSDDFSNGNFPAKHLLKDVNLILKTAENLELDTAMLNGVQEIIAKSVKQGFGDDDYSVMYKSIIKK